MNNEVERAVHGESLEVCRDLPWNLQMSTHELIYIRKLYRRKKGNNPCSENKTRNSVCSANKLGNLHIHGHQSAFSKGISSIVEQN